MRFCRARDNGKDVVRTGGANEHSIGELMAMHHIDGVLIGGASLKADPFVEMIWITFQQYKWQVLSTILPAIRSLSGY